MQSQSFADLGVSRPVVAALSERGITEPFAIQQLVVRDVLDGRDVLPGFALPLHELFAELDRQAAPAST